MARLQTRKFGQVPMLLVFLTPIISPTSTDGLSCIGYRIEIVCLIGTLSTVLQHCKHMMKPSDPLLLADVNLCCGIYLAGKVAIYQHLAIPWFPQSDCTVSKLGVDAGSLCCELLADLLIQVILKCQPGVNIVFKSGDLGHGLVFQNLVIYGWVSHNTHMLYL